MSNVGNIIKEKGTFLPVIESDHTVLDALKKLATLSTGALLVVEKDNIIGIISEKDYARKVILEGRKSIDTLVANVMERDIVFIDFEATFEDCLSVMVQKNIHHLPVVRQGQVIHLISMLDVVECITADKKFEVEQLTQYITGERTPTVSKEIKVNYTYLMISR